jgi:hypothetical protein
LILNYPIISLRVMKKMFPLYEQEAEALARNGLWHYSVPEAKFLSYISNVKVCVDDVEPEPFKVKDVTFKLRKLSSVYEVTVKNGFPSGILLADNLKELVEDHIDITPNIYVVVLDNVSAPIIIGNKVTLERLVFPSWEDTYILKPLQDFLKEGEAGNGV